MNCPQKGCGEPLRKARLDVYWCDYCYKAWLIHKLSSYKSFEEASRIVTKEEIWDTFMHNKFAFPNKPQES